MANTTPRKSEILEGLAMYAFLHIPDKGNPARRIAPAYKIDLMLTEKDQLKKAKDLGLKINPASEKHKYPFVKIKSKVDEKRPDGPVVVDAKNNTVPKNILVGNNSKVRVRFLPWTYGEGEITAVLQGVQVLELVAYERKSPFETVEGGFDASSASTSGEAANEAV